MYQLILFFCLFLSAFIFSGPMSTSFKNEKATLENADNTWKNGDPDQALTSYDNISKNAKFKVTKDQALRKKAFALWEAGKKDEALKEFEKHFMTPEQVHTLKKAIGSDEAFSVFLQKVFEEYFAELKDTLLNKTDVAQKKSPYQKLIRFCSETSEPDYSEDRLIEAFLDLKRMYEREAKNEFLNSARSFGNSEYGSSIESFIKFLKDNWAAYEMDTEITERMLELYESNSEGVNDNYKEFDQDRW